MNNTARFVNISVEYKPAQYGGVRVLEHFGLPLSKSNLLPQEEIKEVWIPFVEFCKNTGIKDNPKDPTETPLIKRTYIAWSRDLEDLVGTPLSVIADMQKDLESAQRNQSKTEKKLNKFINMGFWQRLKFLTWGSSNW